MMFQTDILLLKIFQIYLKFVGLDRMFEKVKLAFSVLSIGSVRHDRHLYPFEAT